MRQMPLILALTVLTATVPARAQHEKTPGKARQSVTVPSFGDYRVPPGAIFKGLPASPQFKTPGQRMFRTVIGEAVKRGPNFAGHYTVADWGCGTACESIAIIDAESGTVFDGPFGKLPKAAFYYGSNVDEDKTDLDYRLDSTLFVARGCPNFTACGEYYYEWTGAGFRLLAHVPMTPLPGSEAQPGRK